MLQAAQEICEQSGYPWRAGTLDGWKLFHDPNLGKNQFFKQRKKSGKNS